jgi:ribose-phosphate pyrophosphokinase
MRNVKIFSGRSHPTLTEAICERLGTIPANCELGNFANGETSVEIGTSIRNQDVFIVQSGSSKVNDSIMEMLIMIAACKGGSAKSITAVMPYFPYSRQSKKRSHRGAITAKMLANLMVVAGIDHVITVDLHASQMQGFFGKPVDNLFAESLIARWIKANVPRWKDAVVVSKNVGGTKRVTSLADALKLSFAIVSTDRTRQPYYVQHNMTDSTIFFNTIEPQVLHQQAIVEDNDDDEADNDSDKPSSPNLRDQGSRRGRPLVNGYVHPSRPKSVIIASSPLIQTTRLDSASPPPSPVRLSRVETPRSARRPSEYEAVGGYTDERAREVITGRLVHGHIVDDDHPSPVLSGMSASGPGLASDRQLQEAMGPAAYDPMISSFVSTASSFQADHALGGTFDAAACSDEEEENIKNPEVEHTMTLVGNVRDKTIFLMDDIIDKSGSWIAAAETCVKRGGAKKVYCVGIHALFGDESLEDMEACDCIDHIVVTNTFPISPQRLRTSRKLAVIDVSQLLSEAIRRNHHGGKFILSHTISPADLLYREHFPAVRYE